MAKAPATKTKPVNTKKAPATGAAAKAAPKAKKVSTKAVADKPQVKSEVAVLEVNTFVGFTGYVSEVAENERDFEKGDTLYIVSVTPAEGENPTMYGVIAAEQVALFLEDPENEDIEGSELVVQEVKALAGKALNEARDTYLPIPSLGRLEAILEEADGDYVDAARGLFNDMEQNSFYLGGILANIRREGLHLVENGGEYEGDTAWDEFCQAEFNFGGAKGGDLARQYTTFAALGSSFDPAQLDGIGWSKLREIQRYVTEENVEELLETARDNTRVQLNTILVEKFAVEGNKTPTGAPATRGSGSGVKTMPITFKLAEDSHTAVTMALAEAKKVYDVATEAEALERIIVAWADEHVQSATKKKQIAKKVDSSAKKVPAAKAAPKAKVAA